jgi:hypothetical protein
MSSVGWEDFEKPNYGVIRGGLSGQSGYMPPEMHLKKLEQTCMYEREDLLNDFFRSTLKDTTPDAPSFAQDLPRETQDELRSNVLNIRHSAARTPAEPIHPDLFLGFTERDKRGYHNSGPDMRKYVNESKKRTRYIDFVSDHASDWTVPGGTRSDVRFIKDLRKTFEASRQRIKVFSTARDNRSVGFTGFKTGGMATVAKTTLDGTILDINDANGLQRKDNTKLKEDLIKVGYRQTGDHRFAVAQYGLTSARQKHYNIHSANSHVQEDRKFDIHPSEVKNRLLINMMKEVDRRKHLEVYRHDMKDSFQESVNSQNKIRKLVSDLMTAQRNTVSTADVIDLGYLGNNVKNVRVYDPVAHDTVIVDKEIFDSVTVNKNITFVKKRDYTARESFFDEGKLKLPGNEVATHVYSRKQPNVLTQLPVRMEQKWNKSEFTPLYKSGQLHAKGVNSSHIEMGQGINPHGDKVFDRHSKGKGDTFAIRSSIDTDSYFNPVDDRDFVPRKMRGRSRI